MADLLMLKCGELVLKGNNRKSFEDKLRTNLKWALKKHGKFKIWAAQSTIYVVPEDENADMDGALESAKKVFGVATISPAFKAEKNFDAICGVAKEKLADVLENATIYDAEVESDTKNESVKILARRNRFYHSKIDVGNLKAGQDYTSLKNVVIIFIMSKDPFGENRMLYTIANRCLELPHLPYYSITFWQ